MRHRWTEGKWPLVRETKVREFEELKLRNRGKRELCWNS